MIILKKCDVAPDRYLRECDTQEVREVIRLIKDRKSFVGRGFSKDKEMKWVGDIPTQIYFHPALRHIFHNPDPVEGEKLRRRFLNERTDFRMGDKKV